MQGLHSIACDADPVQIMNRSTDAGRPRDSVSVCAVMALRYEVCQILAWVAYHRLLQVDRMLLYVDNSMPLHREHEALAGRVLAALRASPHVHVEDLPSNLQYSQKLNYTITQCTWWAHVRSVWMGMWDVDEVPALGPPPSRKVDGGKVDRGMPPSMRDYVKRLPSSTVGVVVPRLEFDCGGREARPVARSQLEVYTRRRCGQAQSGKVLWRADSKATGAGLVINNQHTLRVTAARQNALRSPDGTPGDTTLTASGRWLEAVPPVLLDPSDRNSTALTPASTALRLHHYAQRSTSECSTKHADEVAKAAAGGESTWRARVANECECSHAPACAAQEAPDYSIAQYESLIRLEMTKLFGGDVHAWNVCNRTQTRDSIKT